MILIVVKFQVKPELADQWPELTREFTEETRKEPKNKFFEWSRSLEDPNEYVLLEAFEDDAAEAHVNSGHFKAAQEFFPTILKETPTIINTLIEGKTEWDEMAEFKVS